MDAPNNPGAGTVGAPPITGNIEGGMPPQGGQGGTSPGTQAATTSWLSTLTDESLRTHPGLQKFTSLDGLAKSYVELDKLRHERSGVKPLTAESTPEEVAAYRQAMGIPEAPEKYELGELSFPEEATPTQEDLGVWRKTFHDLHLTQAQTQGIMQAFALDTSAKWNKIAEAQETQTRETLQALSKKYGAQAPALAQLAHEYVKRRYGEDGLRAFDFQPGQPTSIGNNPLLLEILIESAKLTGHDQFIVAQSGGGLMSKEGASKRYDEISAQFYALPEGSPERPALEAEMKRLAPLLG